MFFLGQHLRQRGVDAARRVVLADVAQHQHAGEDHRHRVGDVLAGDVRRRAVHRLEHRALFADVGAGRHAEAADEAGGEIGDDVAEEVRQQQAVKGLRLDHQFHAQRVDDPGVALNARVVLRHVLPRLQEQAVGHFHDIGLVADGHFSAPGLLQVFEAVTRGAFGRAAGDALDRLGGVFVDHAFVADIEVLAVLAEDHQVDVVVARGDAGVVLDRAHVDVEAEFLAQRDGDARVVGAPLLAAAHALDVDTVVAAERRLGGPLQREPVAFDRLQHAGRQRRAEFLLGAQADQHLLELHFRARGLDDGAGRAHDFRADAVTRYYSYLFQS